MEAVTGWGGGGQFIPIMTMVESVTDLEGRFGIQQKANEIV